MLGPHQLMKHHAYATQVAAAMKRPARFNSRQRRRCVHKHESRPAPEPEPELLDWDTIIAAAPVTAVIKRGQGFAACPAFEAAGL